MDICETIDLVSEYSDDCLHSTPPRQVLSPECLIKDSDLVSATPRQRELWTNLLQSPAPSMSVQRSGARRALAGISLGERDQRTGDSSSNSVRRQLFSSPSSAQTLQASQRLVDALGHASRPTEVSAVDADPGTPRRIIAKPRGARAAALRRHSRASSLDQEPIAQPAVVEPVHVTKPSLVRENPINSQAIGARITYAGARSILPDSTMVASDLAMPSLPSIEEELSQPFAHSSGEGIERPADSSDEEDATCAIQSIHALREAGVNNRFLDEANGLLEDIESEGRTSISRRRSAMMTLASKVLDKNYAHKFVLASLDGRVFKAVHPNEDLITLSAQSVVLSSLLANGSSSHDTDSSDLMKQNVDILRALRESASLHTIAKQRKSNMSNMGQKIVADFEAQLLKSSFWPRPLPHVSPRLALLRYIELYVRLAREARVTDAVLPPDVVREIVDHPAAPAATVPQNNLEYHLTSSILEAWSLALGQAEINIDDPTARNYIDVSSLGPRSQAIIGSSTCSAPPTAQHPTDHVSEELLLTLRMMLNLTNGRPKICHALGTLPYISALTSLIEHFFATITSSCTLPQATLASQTRPLDALVLALGLLTNFAEQPASHTPYLTPALPSGASNLTRLLAVYAAQAALVPNRTTLEASGVNVAFGYLAVVVGNLCLVPEIATRARAELEGKAGLLSERGHEMVVEKEGEGDEGLKGLLGHVREFIAMHRRMDEQAGAVLAGNGDADVEDGQDGGMVDAGRVGSGKDGKDGFTQNMEAFVRRMESSCEFR